MGPNILVQQYRTFRSAGDEQSLVSNSTGFQKTRQREEEEDNARISAMTAGLSDLETIKEVGLDSLQREEVKTLIRGLGGSEEGNNQASAPTTRPFMPEIQNAEWGRTLAEETDWLQKVDKLLDFASKGEPGQTGIDVEEDENDLHNEVLSSEKGIALGLQGREIATNTEVEVGGNTHIKREEGKK